MRELPQKETPRELTDEEIKTVSGGTSSSNPLWSQAGGFRNPAGFDAGGWRDNK